MQGQLEKWPKLAGKDARLRAALERLYQLFSDAPNLGSLIDPADLPAADRMFVAGYKQVAPVLEQALAKESNTDNPVTENFVAAAEGVAKAVRLLAGKYILLVTNVPYLARGKQNQFLQEFANTEYPDSKSDLATIFIERCVTFCAKAATVALVTPQHWLFLGTYKKLRMNLLKKMEWNLVAKLGTGAFETIVSTHTPSGSGREGDRTGIEWRQKRGCH